MKKILLIVILIVTMALTASCFSDSPRIDSTYWGTSYGKMETIDGFKVCLRTDGYYQIVGITKQAIHDGILIIPQYINGIPVMGLAANFHNEYERFLMYGQKENETRLSTFLYKNNGSIELEKNVMNKYCLIDAKGNDLFEQINSDIVKKVYINCHHVNGQYEWCFNSKIQVISNSPYSYFVYDTFEDYINDENDFILYNGTFGTNDEYSNKITTLRDYLRTLTMKEIDNRYIFDYYIYTLVARLCSEAFERLTALIIEKSKDLGRDYFNEYESNDFDSQNYYDFVYEKLEKGYPIHFLPANIEFHYNLIIDGVEYHDFIHHTSDLYWIDYIEDGEKVMEPPIPYVEGHTFLGWYTDPECTQRYSFNKQVSQIEDELVWLKLYAKWEKE